MKINNDLLIKDRRPYILWRRVSTKGQGKTELGLDAQTAIAEMFTKRKPKIIYTDIYTGTKLKLCVNLWRAIDMCKKHNYLLVIAKTDRFRNVREALEVLETVGEGNLAFCDMPTVNKFILTIMFAVWESQAMMGRVNTKLALDERRKQLEENGGWISKSGKWCTHFGRNKGDVIEGQKYAAKAITDKYLEWQESSVGFQWVKRQILKGRKNYEIIEEFNQNFTLGVEGFCTRNGKKLTGAMLSRWKKAMGLSRNGK